MRDVHQLPAISCGVLPFRGWISSFTLVSDLKKDQVRGLHVRDESRGGVHKYL